MLQTVLHIIFALFFLYLAASVLYLLMLSIAARFRKKIDYSMVAEKKKIAVFIPSYKEDGIIVDTALQASRHFYPSDKFTVIVIADKLQSETVAKLKAIPVEVVEVAFDVSMKSKSLNAALNKFDDKGFDIGMILDADNVMGTDCLEKVNAAFHKGYEVVQCHRTAKNQQTPVALLDAISEEINNNIFRQGQRAMGLPSSLIGSGIAFDYSLLHYIFNLPEIQNNPGEDREIDVQLVIKKMDVEYIEDAYVYDEKVASAAVFERQRVRWLEAQVTHIKGFLQPKLASQRSSRVFLHKFFQCFLLPRLLYIALFGVMLVLLLVQYLFSASFIFPSAEIWIALTVLYFATLLLSIPGRFYTMTTFKAILHIPLLAVSMIKAMLKIKTNRRYFIHTPKTFSSK